MEHTCIDTAGWCAGCEENLVRLGMRDLTISRACEDRLRFEMPLAGSSFQSATLYKLGQCIADLRICVEQMTDVQACQFAQDELLPLENELAQLTRQALTKETL